MSGAPRPSRALGLVGVALTAAVSAGVGFLLGTAAIHRVAPLAPLELPAPRNPLDLSDALGLLGSAGIRVLAGHLQGLPLIALETDRTVVVTVPSGRGRIHYVLVPKKDIRDVGEIAPADAPYLTDLFLTARKLVERDRLVDYRVYSNGPGEQSVGYLHFHLVGKRPGRK